MTESESDSDLAEQSYPELMNVARSARENHDADISTDGPTKDVLVENMEDEGIEFDDGAYTIEGEEVELMESNPSSDSSGSSGPSDKTVLYCHRRAATTEDRLEEISDALGELGYELQETESEQDTLKVVLPVSEQEGVEEVEEDDEDTDSEDASEETSDDAEESDESDESEAESDSDEEEEEEGGEEEDSSESESEESEEDSEDEAEEKVDYEVYKERLEDKTKDEVYSTAVELDIDDRSDMSKAELIDAVLEARVEEGKVAEA